MRLSQLWVFVVGCCGLTFAGVVCPGFAFTFSERVRLLGVVLERSRSELDAGGPEFEGPLDEPWLGEAVAEPACELPALE